MTKEEAIQAMREGDKVSHYYFSEKEFVEMKNEKIIMPDGEECTPEEFSDSYQEHCYDEDWDIL